MMVLPADHVMGDVTAVGRLAEQGLTAAEAGRIVVFGLKPSHPETGYGYIRADGEIVAWRGVRNVAAFVEKPDATTAEAYIADGCLWNSGMFMMRADVGLAEIGRLHPAVASVAEAAVADMTRDLEFHRLHKTPWCEMPRLSFDHAVMEATDRAVVIEADTDWSDIGNWQSVWQVHDKDGRGNVTIGEVQLRDSQRSLVRSDRLFVGAIGLDDFMVVASDDAVLVAPLARAGEVKLLVDDLRRRNSTIVNEHPRVHRPWGYYESIHRGDRHQVKRICVKPGARLSLQMHHHRAEHWVVVAGTALVTRDEKSELIQENESIYIPGGTPHRLHNPGKIPLEVIEVQSGSYLGEDDIVRFEDDYQRA
jgi:mannose-1-phosphate guanylyltransferase/mannose-1-phosphate guanylyltransferase/mannose-6-phosphate isomerase